MAERIIEIDEEGNVSIPLDPLDEITQLQEQNTKLVLEKRELEGKLSRHDNEWQMALQREAKLALRVRELEQKLISQDGWNQQDHNQREGREKKLRKRIKGLERQLEKCADADYKRALTARAKGKGE